MRLAVFDIDGTLVTGPSTEKRFALHLARSGRIGPRQAFAFLAFLVRHAPVYRKLVLKKDKAYLSGMAEGDVASLASGWAEAALKEAWFEPCVARLRRHQQAGDRVVLLSGTPQFVAAAVARALGVEDVLGTRCDARDGRYLAGPPGRHPFADEKVAILREWARSRGVDGADIVAYGDSVHDLPLFEVAGKPVAVRPDEELAAVADARGWEVIGPVRRSLLGRLRPALRPSVDADLADRR